jgi:hypothetical protein
VRASGGPLKIVVGTAAELSPCVWFTKGFRRPTAFDEEGVESIDDDMNEAISEDESRGGLKKKRGGDKSPQSCGAGVGPGTELEGVETASESKSTGRA